MKYTIVIQPDAEHELKSAARWIAARNPSAARKWLVTLLAEIDSLEQFPARCPLAPENEFFKEEIRHLLVGNFRVLFTITGDSVSVLHVRRMSQDTLRPPQ